MESKLCAHCKQLKPVTEFWRRSSSPDGREYSCRTCRARKGERQPAQRTGLGQRHVPGYESLMAEVFNLTVKDYQSERPIKFGFAAGDSRTRNGEHDNLVWAGFEVSKAECLEFVEGPDFEYYARAIDIPLTIDEMRRVMLDRMGVNDVLVEVR